MANMMIIDERVTEMLNIHLRVSEGSSLFDALLLCN